MTQILDQAIPENGSVAGDVLAAGHALQQVRTSYATAVAVQKPRQYPLVERRLLEEARLAGEDFYYGWAAGKDRIEGPSVDLAVAAARCWGNCALDALPVQDLPDSWIFTASFIDLETGFTMTRQFRQSKQWTVHGRLDEERKADVRFQIGQSKAARNVILKCLPRALVNKAMEEAKKGVKEKLERFIADKGIAAAIDLLIKGLGKCGVKEPLILAKFGVAERRALTVEHLVVMRGDLTALDTGQERPETLYPAPTVDEATDKLREKLKTGNGAAKPAAAAPLQPSAPPSAAADFHPDERIGLPESADQAALQLEREQQIADFRQQIEAAESGAEKGRILTALDRAEEFLGAAAVAELRAMMQAKGGNGKKRSTEF